MFRPKGSRTFKTRITLPDGRTVLRSTERQVEADAEDVERMVKVWAGARGQRHARLDVLEAIVAGRVTLAAAYDAALAGALDALLAALPVVDTSPPLRELLEGFRAHKATQRSADTAAGYVRQLELLLPAEWRLSQLTRRAAFEQLERLEVQGPTKNRYRAALSQFVKYLVQRGLLETNFVRDLEGYSEHPPRLHLYTLADAERLIAGLPQPDQAIAAFAAMFCAEWAAIERLRVADVDLAREALHRVGATVRGTKRVHRLRVVPLVPELAHLWRYFAPALKGKLPDALVFEGRQNQAVLRRQQRTAKALGLDPAHTLHDWRHDHTVWLLQAGYAPAIAAAHLGHANTALVHRVYGRWIVGEQDYTRGRAATDSATTLPNHMKAGGVKP